ncbi:MAG TPA: hypothetical protein VLF67_01730 [Candidatus Saccharimonas sp.]|nr:hypothetical protein [Candidatus Saccharimonas sp.]
MDTQTTLDTFKANIARGIAARQESEHPGNPLDEFAFRLGTAGDVPWPQVGKRGWTRGIKDSCVLLVMVDGFWVVGANINGGRVFYDSTMTEPPSAEMLATMSDLATRWVNRENVPVKRTKSAPPAKKAPATAKTVTKKRPAKKAAKAPKVEVAA